MFAVLAENGQGLNEVSSHSVLHEAFLLVVGRAAHRAARQPRDAAVTKCVPFLAAALRVVQYPIAHTTFHALAYWVHEVDVVSHCLRQDLRSEPCSCAAVKPRERQRND